MKLHNKTLKLYSYSHILQDLLNQEFADIEMQKQLAKNKVFKFIYLILQGHFTEEKKEILLELNKAIIVDSDIKKIVEDHEIFEKLLRSALYKDNQPLLAFFIHDLHIENGQYPIIENEYPNIKILIEKRKLNEQLQNELMDENKLKKSKNKI